MKSCESRASRAKPSVFLLWTQPKDKRAPRPALQSSKPDLRPASTALHRTEVASVGSLMATSPSTQATLALDLLRSKPNQQKKARRKDRRLFLNYYRKAYLKGH